MPISSNKSNLKVTTVVGDKTYEDEQYRDAFYGRNQQKEPSTHRPIVPDHRQLPPEAIEAIKVEVDERLQEALDKDLSTRAIKTRKTKPMATKSSPTKTQK